MKINPFYKKWLFAEIKAGHFNYLFLAIFISVASLTTIGFLIEHMRLSFSQQTAELLGADVAYQASHHIDIKRYSGGRDAQAKMITFSTMLANDDEFQLTNVKAISRHFPLRGDLLIKKTLNAPETRANMPKTGTIWVDKRILQALHLHIGDEVEMGNVRLVVAAIIIKIVDQGEVFSFAPIAVMNIADLAKTQVIQAGSRAEYVYYFNFLTKQDDIYAQLKSNQRVGHQLKKRDDNFQKISKHLNNGRSFLAISALLTLFICSVTIYINSYQYAEKQIKNSAIIRCLGGSSRQVFGLHFWLLFIVSMVASLLAILLGFLVYLLMLKGFSSYLSNTPSQFFMRTVFTALISGLFLLLAMVYGHLQALKLSSPMLLIRESWPHPNANQKIIFSLSFIVLLLISIVYSHSLWISGYFYSALLLSIGGIALLLQPFFLLFKYLSKHLTGSVKLALISFSTHYRNVSLQIICFSFIISIMLTVMILRTTLITEWHNHIPEKTPNHFVINLQTYNKADFATFLSTHGVQFTGIYPIIRGRLIAKNDKPILASATKKAKRHNALNRELNLTYATDMPDYNRITQGQWRTSIENEISIEQSLARLLHLKLGDKVTFQIAAQTMSGVLSSIRKVQWESFLPNFYFILTPEALQSFPKTYIVSFYLSAEQKPMLNTLLKEFKGVTILEMDSIIAEVRIILKHLIFAVSLLFSFVMLAAILLFMSALSSSFMSKHYENCIKRTLGASNRKMRLALLWEMFLISGLSCFVAIFLAETGVALFNYGVFNSPIIWHIEYWLPTFCLTLMLVIASSLFYINKLLRTTHLLHSM